MSRKKNLGLGKVKKIVATVFEIEEINVDLAMSPANVENWDSFGQLLLVETIEREFNITLSMEEVFSVITVQDICDILERKNII